MDSKEFIEKMEEVLDTEETISMDTVLAELEEWDSLSLVSYIAMANAGYGKKINPADVKNAVKISDLYELLQG